MKELIIIPTYNEKENIEKIIRKVYSLSHKFDILIIEDNSPDGTADIVKKLQSEFSNLHILERKGKLGLGTAYIVGFKWGIEHQYDKIFEMDADFSHNPEDVPRLSEALDTYDVAIGSRYITGLNVVNWPLGRVLMSYFGSKYVRLITGMKVNDTTAGFVGYRKEVLERMNLHGIKMKGYGFQIEMKFTAYKMGFSIKEIPIIFVNRTEGESKMHGGIFKEALWGVLHMKIASWGKKYG